MFELKKITSLSKINKELINAKTVEEQLKSMRIGYIAHAFILQSLELEFNKYYDKNNIESFSKEVLGRSMKHAERQIENPEYYTRKVANTLDEDTRKCIQILLMLNGKAGNIETKKAEIDVVERNIIWLNDLLKELK